MNTGGIKTIYLACDFDEKFPVISADSFDNMRKALDNYCGADERNSGKFIAFVPYDSKYPSDYEGYYEYECCTNGNNWDNTYTDKFRIYCVEFYPPTIDKV